MQPHDVRFRDEEQALLMVRPTGSFDVGPDRLGEYRHAAVFVEAEQPRHRRSTLDRDGRRLHRPTGSAMSRFAIEPAIAKD